MNDFLYFFSFSLSFSLFPFISLAWSNFHRDDKFQFSRRFRTRNLLDFLQHLSSEVTPAMYHLQGRTLKTLSNRRTKWKISVILYGNRIQSKWILMKNDCYIGGGDLLWKTSFLKRWSTLAARQACILREIREDSGSSNNKTPTLELSLNFPAGNWLRLSSKARIAAPQIINTAALLRLRIGNFRSRRVSLDNFTRGYRKSLLNILRSFSIK